MQNAIQEFTIGFFDSSGVFSIYAKQRDIGRVVKFHLYDPGSSEDYKELLSDDDLIITVRVRLPSGTNLPDIEVDKSAIDLEELSITIPLTFEMLQQYGTAECDLVFASLKESHILSTVHFKLIIVESFNYPQDVTKEYFETWTELYIALRALEEQIQHNEDLRVEAENTRVSNENIREANEEERKEAEDAREEAEDAREEAEDARKEAEDARKEAETAREEAEDARKEAEAIRERKVQEQVDEAHMWADGKTCETDPDDKPSATNNAKYWAEQASSAHDDILNSLSDIIAPTETSPTQSSYEVGNYLIYDGDFYKVTSAISVGDNLVEGTNIEKTTVGEELQNRGGGGIVIVQIPTVIIGEYTYNGSEQGPTITGLDTTKVNVTDATATNPGTYTMVLSLKDPTTMVWSDLTSTSKSYQYTISLVGIYGISWDGGSNSAWTRTDAAENFIDPVPAVNNGDGSSPFDNILPWSGMQIVEDQIAGTLVSIPKYYYKWTKTGTVMKLQISSSPKDGFHVSPAHANRDDGHGERDVVYVGRYHSGAFIKSETNRWPTTDTIAEGRTEIHELGNEYWQYDFAMYWTIMMLYLVEYADWDSQKKIGYGCGNNDHSENSGTTDGMIYHTGTNATNRTTYGHTQYRHIEDLWGNAMDWCDGIYVTSDSVYVINNPANYSNTYIGTKIGSRSGGSSGGIISSFNIPTESGFEWALYPKNFTNTYSSPTYVCDEANYYARSRSAVSIGGTWNQTLSSGAFAMNLGADYSTSSSGYGIRLQKLPNNT